MHALKLASISSFTKIAAVTVFLLCLAIQGGFAGALNIDSSGVAMQGYDPVGYFYQSAPVKGSPEFSAEHDGATYWFSSMENLDTFKANPEMFVPAYGGYCAYGVSQGVKVPIDPEAFSVVDGKLYLNITKEVQKTWEQDIPGYIKKADRIWPVLAGS